MKKLILFLLAIATVGCVGQPHQNVMPHPTPTVDYVKHMDPFGAAHRDMFLSQLAMNYRSFAIFNATMSGFPEIGELFAQKAVAAFAGQRTEPESLDFWVVTDQNELFELRNASRELRAVLDDGVPMERPKLAAEAQAKFDCWIAASASHQFATARECRTRFERAMMAINGNGGIVDFDEDRIFEQQPEFIPTTGFAENNAGVSTAELFALTDTRRTREGVVVVNNINVPSDLIRPAPVHPVVFNQHIHASGAVVEGAGGGTLGGEMVSRDEFINMMMALRKEIQDINRRLESAPTPQPCPDQGMARLKVQKIPETPKQRIMEEVFEVRFDFNRSVIKPEFEPVIRQLAASARENANMKVTVVGHTDTVGSSNVNFALGGRRAEAVKKTLIQHGVPASSIIILSAGKNDLAVPTGPNVKNAENRRARVVKEIRHPGEPQALGTGGARTTGPAGGSAGGTAMYGTPNSGSVTKPLPVLED